MKPLLICVHVFYPVLWPELRERLRFIVKWPHELHVTMTQELPAVRDEALALDPRAVIEIVPNRGYDIAPFVHIINSVDLNAYSYVIKLHTKNDMDASRNFLLNGYALAQTPGRWRSFLLSFARDEATFSRGLGCMARAPNVGMVADVRCTTTVQEQDDGDEANFNNFLKRYNLVGGRSIPFVAGAMFMARASLFFQLQRLDLSWEDFATPRAGVHNGQLAHVIERFCGYQVAHAGYAIADSNEQTQSTWKDNMKRRLIACHGFLLKARLCHSGKWAGACVLKVCGIPISHFKPL